MLINLGIIVGLLTLNALSAQIGQNNDKLKPVETSVFTQILDQAVKNNQVTGGNLLIFTRDQTLLKHPFGYRDFEEGIRFDSIKTRFLSPALSKLMVTIAVLQLAEKDKVKLDVDVNKYLKRFSVPFAFDRSLNLHNLLSGLDGFDTPRSGTCVVDLNQLQPLRSFLQANLPKRIYPPNEVVAFNDFAFSIAAAVVEEITGLRFDIYCQEAIFRKLGLTNTAFIVDQAYEPTIAKTYYYDIDKGYKAYPPLWHQIYPARTLTTTVRDVEKLSRALLDPTLLDSLGILKIDTYDQHLFYLDPKLKRQTNYFFGNGFWKRPFLQTIGLTNKETTLGSTSGYLFFPELKLGLFFYANSPADAVYEQLVQALMVQTTSPVNAEIKAPAGTELRIQNYTGTYFSTNRGNYELLGNQTAYQNILELKAYSKNPRQLVVNYWPSQISQTFNEYSENLFLEQNGINSLLFLNISHKPFLFTQGISYEKLAFYQSPLILTWLTFSVWLSYGLYLLYRCLFRRLFIFGIERRITKNPLSRLVGVTDIIGIIIVIFSLGMIGVYYLSTPVDPFLKKPFYLKLLFFCPILIEFLGLFQLYLIHSHWQKLQTRQRIAYLWLFVCMLFTWHVTSVLQINYH